MDFHEIKYYNIKSTVPQEYHPPGPNSTGRTSCCVNSTYFKIVLCLSELCFFLLFISTFYLFVFQRGLTYFVFEYLFFVSKLSYSLIFIYYCHFVRLLLVLYISSGAGRCLWFIYFNQLSPFPSFGASYYYFESNSPHGITIANSHSSQFFSKLFSLLLK